MNLLGKILIIFFLLVPVSSAINITVDYPKKVNQNQEIEFNIKLQENSEKTYDVKIDLFGRDGKRISKIFDDEKWKSSIYYLKDALKNEGNFNIKVEEYEGIAGIIIKLRDSSGKIFKFEGNEIEILKELEKDKPGIKKELKNDSFSLEKPKNDQEIINLRPKNFKNGDEVKDTKEKNYSKYPFIIFCIILLLLYIIKPKKKKNEWRD